MPDQIDKVPYQKGLITLSVLMLIYVFGQAEFKSQLTIALVGLQLKNPDIIGQFLFVALAWYTIRFWRTGVEKNGWTYQKDTLEYILELLKQEPLRSEAIKKAISNGIDLSDYAGLIFGFEKDSRNSKQLSISKYTPVGGSIDPIGSFKTGLQLRFKLEMYSMLYWLTTSDGFSYRYLPFYVAIFSLWCAVLS